MRRLEDAAAWCNVELDGVVFRAQIIHASRGKYEILDDNKQGNFVGRIIDASDIFNCD
ncbi:MAG TPA: hypothetical protein VE572_02900 [Nitrososphaeraceae archaeon]|jgi:hypothetical protein|nr:hypothetical protein [Nitrososphaeraceae archaeon]